MTHSPPILALMTSSIDKGTPQCSSYLYRSFSMLNLSFVNSKHQVSATTLVSVRNTQVFRTARTALTEPHTLWWRITCFQSPWWRVHVYWTNVVAFRCTWEHMGTRWITGEQTGKNIFFGYAAGAPANHSYYCSFNDCQNLCLQFVFTSRYQCSYIATYLHAVIGSNSRCAWR
jgi:hypothetical protein